MANRFYCVRSSHQRRLFMVYFAEVCDSAVLPVFGSRFVPACSLGSL